MQNSKSMSAFFKEDLNAPLANVQWSWGAENEKGIYLRIWASEVIEDEERNSKALVLGQINTDTRLGQKERLRQINSIKEGKPGYVVVITSHFETEDGAWRIDEYNECVYAIESLNEKDGSIYANVNFNAPIYPAYIGQEIDVDAIVLAASKIKKSADMLNKAMTKFDWQPTSLCADKEIINLLSKDGKHKAQIIIPQSKWVRL